MPHSFARNTFACIEQVCYTHPDPGTGKTSFYVQEKTNQGGLIEEDFRFGRYPAQDEHKAMPRRTVMQVIFVGGAQEVGASCLAVELGGHWIVIDGGVRLDRKSDPLPDLALLEGKAIQAIFVTHAHADHIG